MPAGPDWALSLIDIDDDEVPEPAPSIIEGGPPWVTSPPPPEPWAPLAVPEVVLSEPEHSAAPRARPSPTYPEPEEDVAPVARRTSDPGPSPMLLDPKRRARCPAGDHSHAHSPERPRNRSAPPAEVVGSRASSQPTSRHHRARQGRGEGSPPEAPGPPGRARPDCLTRLTTGAGRGHRTQERGQETANDAAQEVTHRPPARVLSLDAGVREPRGAVAP